MLKINIGDKITVPIHMGSRDKRNEDIECEVVALYPHFFRVKCYPNPASNKFFYECFAYYGKWES